MPSNPKKGKPLKCTENLKEFYENEDEFKFPEGVYLIKSLSWITKAFLLKVYTEV